MDQTYLKLNDGNVIPRFGMGAYQVPEGEATIHAISEALKLGYCHIDTAHAYRNESVRRHILVGVNRVLFRQIHMIVQDRNFRRFTAV